MADSISIPPTSNNAVLTATTGALSGDGTSVNKLQVNVDGTTIGVNGSNELEALGGGNPFDQDLNTDDDVTFASVALGTGPFASTGQLRLPNGGSIYARYVGNDGDIPLVSSGPQFSLVADSATFGDTSGTQSSIIAGYDVFFANQSAEPAWVFNPTSTHTAQLWLLTEDDVLLFGYGRSGGTSRKFGFGSELDPSGLNTGETAIGGKESISLQVNGSRIAVVDSSGISVDAIAANAALDLNPATDLTINGTPGVTAGPFTVVTSIATTKGLVTTLTGT